MKKDYILMSFLILTLMFSFGFASIKNVGALNCVIPSSGGTGSTNNGPMDCASGGGQCALAGGNCQEIVSLEGNQIRVADNLNKVMILTFNTLGAKQFRGWESALKIDNKYCYTKKEPLAKIPGKSPLLGRLFS